MNADIEREARRQQLLLRTLWRDEPADALQAWLRPPRQGLQGHGLAAYRANADAVAERALASAFPTVAALVGAESFAGLARDFWHRQPPARGDLGEWGAALPAFIAASDSLASEAYLADSARLDWLAHQASRAADGPHAAPALDALAEQSPELLRLVLRPACALLASPYPVVAIWQAHQARGDDRFAPVRAAFAEARADTAFVWRDGFAVCVEALEANAAAFTAAVLCGAALSAALDAAGAGFAFERWLAQALQQRWLLGVDVLAKPRPP